MKLGLSTATFNTTLNMIWGLLVPLLFFFISTNNGLHLSPDSLWYSEIAANLAQGKGFQLNNGAYISTWSPLFPLLLSLGYPLIAKWGWIIQALTLLASYTFLLRLGQKLLSPPFSYAYCFLLATSAPLLGVYVYLWSEGVFIMLLSIYLYLVYKYVSEGESRILLFAAVAGCLLFLQRNAGFFVLAGLYAGLLNISWNKKSKDRGLLLIHGLLIYSGGIIWNIYRLFVEQELEAAHKIVSPTIDLFEGAYMVLTEYSLNFFPFLALHAAYAGILLVLTILIGMGRLAFGKIVTPFYKLLYLGLMGYSAAWLIIPTDMDSIDRLLAPMLPIFFLLLTMLIENKGKVQPLLHAKWIKGLFLLWLLYPMLRMVKNSLMWGGLL